jgi:hypothetical protein
MVYTPVIPAQGRWRQEDWEFEASFVYIVKSCLNPPSPQKKKLN